MCQSFIQSTREVEHAVQSHASVAAAQDCICGRNTSPARALFLTPVLTPAPPGQTVARQTAAVRCRAGHRLRRCRCAAHCCAAPLRRATPCRSAVLAAAAAAAAGQHSGCCPADRRPASCGRNGSAAPTSTGSSCGPRGASSEPGAVTAESHHFSVARARLLLARLSALCSRSHQVDVHRLKLTIDKGHRHGGTRQVGL